LFGGGANNYSLQRSREERMRRHMRTLTLHALAAVFAAGCGMQVQNYTHNVDRGRPGATAETAVLVIARRGGIGEMITLMDANGNVIGQLYHDAWVRIPLLPGRHRIYAITARFETGSLVDVEAQPGRVYHAAIPRMRAMVAIAPRHTDRWENRWTWIDGGREVELDTTQMSLLEAELPLEFRRAVIANTDAAFASLAAQEQQDYVLGAGDGEAL
jgi:hypothetical protein